MSVLGQHTHFVVELIQQLLTYVRVENFLYRHLQLHITSPVDSAEAAHRNLLPYIQITHLQHQHSVHALTLALHLHSVFILVARSSPIKRLIRGWRLLSLENVRIPAYFSRFFAGFLLNKPAGCLVFRGFACVFERTLVFEAVRECICKILFVADGEQRFKLWG